MYVREKGMASSEGFSEIRHLLPLSVVRKLARTNKAFRDAYLAHPGWQQTWRVLHGWLCSHWRQGGNSQENLYTTSELHCEGDGERSLSIPYVGLYMSLVFVPEVNGRWQHWVLNVDRFRITDMETPFGSAGFRTGQYSHVEHMDYSFLSYADGLVYSDAYTPRWLLINTLMRLFRHDVTERKDILRMVQLLNTGVIAYDPVKDVIPSSVSRLAPRKGKSSPSSGAKTPTFLPLMKSLSGRIAYLTKNLTVKTLNITTEKLAIIEKKNYAALLGALDKVVGKSLPTNMLERTSSPRLLVHLLEYYKCIPYRNLTKITLITELIELLTYFYKGRQSHPEPPSIEKYHRASTAAQLALIAQDRERIADSRVPKRPRPMADDEAVAMVIVVEDEDEDGEQGSG